MDFGGCARFWNWRTLFGVSDSSWLWSIEIRFCISRTSRFGEWFVMNIWGIELFKTSKFSGGSISVALTPFMGVKFGSPSNKTVSTEEVEDGGSSKSKRSPVKGSTRTVKVLQIFFDSFRNRKVWYWWNIWLFLKLCFRKLEPLTS